MSLLVITNFEGGFEVQALKSWPSQLPPFGKAEAVLSVS